MTKTIKKSLIAVLLFVMAFVGSLAISNVRIASADEAKIAAFTTAMTKVADAGIDANSDTSILADAEKVALIKDAKSAYDKLSADDKAVVDVAAFEAIYNKVLLDAETIVLYHNAELYDYVLGIDGATVTYSQKALFDERVEDYGNLDANEKAYVDAATYNLEYFADMTSKLAAIEGKMDAAKAEIIDIKAYDAGAMVDFTGTQDIVVNSAASIGEATTALKEIYGIEYKDLAEVEQKAIIAYVTEAIFNNYKTALVEYSQIEIDAALLAQEIEDTYAAVLANNSYYDNAQAITDLQTKFNDNKHDTIKVGADLVDDYTSLIEVATANKVQELVDGLDGINAKITAINAKIAELLAQKVVDTANGIYTSECKEDIYSVTDGVEKQFGGLESYVQENVDTIVTDWDKYVEAKAEYDAAAQEVQDLIDAINDIVADDSNIVVDFDAASKLYASFVPNQKNQFDTNAYGETLGGVSMPYYLNAYKYVQSKAGKIAVEAAKFATKIDNLEYEFSVEFFAVITALNEEYKALDVNVQNAVTNYNVLKGYIDQYNTELGGAQGWQNAVNAIAPNGVVPTITYAKALEITEGTGAPKTLWIALDSTLQGVVATNSSDNEYYATYVTYMQLITGANKVIALYSDANTKVGEINVDNKPAVGAPTTAFVNTFNAAKTALELLTTGTVDYVIVVGNVDDAINGETDDIVYTVNYDAADALTVIEPSAAYSNYQTAKVWCETFSIEADIDALYTGDELEATAIANVTYGILASLEACETAYGAVTEGKRDYYITKLASARKAYNLLAAEVNAWILSVAKLIDANATEATMNAIITAAIPEAVISFDLAQFDDTNPDSIISKYNDIYTSEKEADLKAAKDMFDALQTKANTVVNTLNTDIATINALSEITSGNLDLINSIEYRYSNIHSTQQALISGYDQFKAAYNKANFQKFYKDAVAKLQAEVEDEIFTVEGAIMLSTLQSIYNAVSTELQGLVTNDYLALEEIAKAYAGKSLLDLKTVNGKLEGALADILDLQGDLADVAGDLSDLIDELENAFADLDNDLADLDNGLADIQSQINGVNFTIEFLTAYLEQFAFDYTETIEGIVASIVKEAEDRDAADAILDAAIDAVVADLAQAKIDIKTAYEAAIAEAVAKLEAADAALKAGYEAADAALKAAYEAADAALTAALTKEVSDREAADAALKAAVEAADAALKAALDKETADREAADKALEEKLMAEIKSLNTKLVVASVILAVFTAALIGAVVYIFLKMFKKEN